MEVNGALKGHSESSGQEAPADIEMNMDSENPDISRLPGDFDATWYASEYQDVALLGMEPAEHFLRVGVLLGRRANGEIPPEPGKGIAVVFHAFHKDIIAEVSERIAKIPGEFDLFVTTSIPEQHSCLDSIRERHVNIEFIHCENQGRDVKPFIELLPRLLDYELCLKVHTKSGHTGYGDLWRKICMETLLPSTESIGAILERFEQNRRLLLAGPEPLYWSGRRLMFGNRPWLHYLRLALNLDAGLDDEWGFFAGTMFWFRPKLFSRLIGIFSGDEFVVGNTGIDGNMEHALERLFGLLCVDRRAEIGLLPWKNGQPGMRICPAPGIPVVGAAYHILEKLKKLADGGDIGLPA